MRKYCDNCRKKIRFWHKYLKLEFEFIKANGETLKYFEHYHINCISEEELIRLTNL